MENYCETLRGLIGQSDLEKTAEIMCEQILTEIKDKASYKIKVKKYIENFSQKLVHKDARKTAVVLELLLAEENEMWVERDYLEVSLDNPDFIRDPDLNLKPWGGRSSETSCPEGFYNCNWTGHIRTYGVSGLDLEYCLDAPVKLKDEKTKKFATSNELVLANIILEFTVYGFLEADVKSFWEEMDRRVKEVEEGRTKTFTTEEVREQLGLE